MEKIEKPEIDLEVEYRRLSENEKIYHEKIDFWDKLEKNTLRLIAISLVVFIVSISASPESNAPMLELFPKYPLYVCIASASMGLFFFSFVAHSLISGKASKIRRELGLHREERLYLRAYDIHNNIDTYLNETNPNRKPFFKKLALENTEKMIQIVNGWEYGNINLIKNLVGDQIDLLKDNMKRLVLSNVAQGDETALRKISETLIEFCKHIHSPSIEKLDKLNNMIKELPYKEYKFLTTKEKVGEYFYSKPRAFRLLFASGTTIVVAVVMLFLGQNTGVVFAVCVTCFWGSFAGFDKIFRLKG